MPIEHGLVTKRDRERPEAGRRPQLRHPQEPARVRRRDEPAARAPSTSCAARSWPRAPASRSWSTTRTEDQVKTRVKLRPSRRSRWARLQGDDPRRARGRHRLASPRPTPRRQPRHVGLRGAGRAVKETFNLEMSFTAAGRAKKCRRQSTRAAEKVAIAGARRGVRRGVPPLPPGATSRPSTGCGRTTCWRWTTCARASAVAMARRTRWLPSSARPSTMFDELKDNIRNRIVYNFFKNADNWQLRLRQVQLEAEAPPRRRPRPAAARPTPPRRRSRPPSAPPPGGRPPSAARRSESGATTPARAAPARSSRTATACRAKRTS